MKKLFLLLVLLLSAALAGCQKQEQAPIATSPTGSKPAAVSTLNVPSGSQLLPDSGCTVIAKKPTPGPTAEPLYPVVTESDHVKGPANAKVTIIEYSDFQ